ncbi:MAG TPA: YhjD/YihY/BrkB family envelope integrity protein [Gemmatimonadaceae bacterium]
MVFGTALADYLRRIWNHSADDDLLFLASGVAFGILLAALPFVLLIMSGLATLLQATPERTALTVHQLLDTLLPRHGADEESVHALINGVVETRGALGIWGAILYLWFTARLFGALRSALSQVLDFGTQRGVVAGKLHDLRLTIVATVLITGYLALTAYVAIATSRGVQFFERLGLRKDVMSGVEYTIGRLLAFILIVALIFLLYRFIPVRGIPTRAALAGAIAASIMFELTRVAYAALTGLLSPATLYTGVLYTIVSVVFWVYYAAVIFLIGGEVARVYEIRNANRVTV